jgi:ubiquinone/menaquinone biosynthesis C-methylase UbiE
MLAVLDAVFFTLTAQPRASVISIYDRLAPRYDRLHRRWLRVGGGETVAALQGCLAAELRPGIRVLDAGCGTGALGRWIMAHEPRASLTLLDAAPGMLKRTQAIPAQRVHGDLLMLPFPTGWFDIVTCAWALETTGNPDRAFHELYRVVAPGGLLCCCFCTEPSTWAASVRSTPTRFSITHFFGGRFLAADYSAGLNGGRARRMQFHDGLSTFTCHRKLAAAGS